jgi:periplasmic protein CpxP/Spy
MKNGIKRVLMVVASGALVLAAVSACGHRDHERHGKWSEERITQMQDKAVERVAKKWDLNADQKQKLTTLTQQMLAARQNVKGNSDKPLEELKSFIDGPTLDRSKAQAWVDRKTQAVQKSSSPVIEALGDFYDSLTPTQQAQVRALMQEKQGWARGWSRS